MEEYEIRINIGGVVELAVFLTIVLALGNLLKLWTISWWWVFSPVLALLAATGITILVVFIVIIVKNLAERRI